MAAGNVNPIPQWQEPAVDPKTGRWKPNWFKWIQPLLATVVENKGAIVVQGEAISTVQATLVDMNAAIETETSARVDGDEALATQITSITASIGEIGTDLNAVEAAVTAEAGARAAADEALAGQVTTITAAIGDIETDITAVEASISSEASARASADETIADSVDALTTTVNGNTSTIATHTTAINGIGASWGVTVDINNHIVGQAKLDGSVSGSSFDVVADKFRIYHPTSSGISAAVFSIEEVDGVDKLVFNGDMITNTFEAGEGKFGNATVTGILSGGPGGKLKVDFTNGRIRGLA